MDVAMNSPRADQPEETKTLVSWKEVASFLDRAERTVRRWERERGLPVHRVPGGERSSVFAYSSELNSWLLGEQGKVALSTAAEHDADEEGALPDAARPVTSLDAGPIPDRDLPVEEPVHQQAGFRRWIAWVATPAVILGLAGSAIFTFGHYEGVAAAKHSASAVASKSSSYTPSPRAEALYLQGRYQWSLRTSDSLTKSIDDYTRAIVEDPAYAPAYAGLAESYDLLPEYGGIDRGEAFARAKAAADRAIQLDPNLAAGHRAKAFALFYWDWNVPASDAEFRRALALNPNEMETHHWYATALFSRQERAQSMAEIDEALRLSPTTPAIIVDAAYIHAWFHNNREANIKTLRDLAQTQPNLVKPIRYLADFDFDDGNYPAYLAEIRTTANITNNADDIALADAAAQGWARSGKLGLIEGMRRAQQAAFARGTTSGWSLAVSYVRLGRPKEALPYFNAALDRHEFAFMTIDSVDWLASLQSDPGYASLFRQVHERMHLPPPSPLNLAAAAKPEARSPIAIEPR